MESVLAILCIVFFAVLTYGLIQGRNLTKNPNITWKNIKNNLDKPWDFKILSNCNKINWDIIKNNINLDWNWFNLSKRDDITWNIISNNFNFPWNWKAISRFGDININILLKIYIINIHDLFYI